MDPFATLGIPRRFDVDLSALEKTHRELSRALHPDKFVNAAPTERREALSRAVEVNEAWRVVRDPLRRAEALFALAGIAVGERNEPPPDPDLLMEVMEKREALAEAKAARDVSALAALVDEIGQKAAGADRALGEAFREAGDDKNALAPHVARLGELRFWRRFLEEASAIEEQIGEERIAAL